MEKERLYRGRGGEMIRESVCKLVESIAIAELKLEKPRILRLLVHTEICVIILIMIDNIGRKLKTPK